MTRLLEQAFAEASKLSPKEQDALAEWLLKDLLSERRWEELFANAQGALAKLAAEAMQEDHHGQTQELDPGAL
jgi:hypothetical protein